MSTATRLEGTRRTKRRVCCKQDLSPEEERAFRILTEEFGLVVDDTLRDQIARRIRAGGINLETASAVRRGIQTHIDDFTEEVRVVARTGAEEGALAGRQRVARQFGLQIATDIVPERTLDELDDWVTTFSDSVPDTLEDDLTDYLRGAHEAGLSVDDVARDLQNEFLDDRIKGSKARQWARDNTVSPSNAGAHSAHQDSDLVVAEEWLATFDDDVRDTHAEAHGQVTGVDTPFRVGGHRARHPGDPALPIGESTMCRCTVVGIQRDELTDDEFATVRGGGRFWR